MLMGHTDGLSELRSSKDRLLSDPESGLEDEDDDISEPILYSASFDELARNVIKYEMVIWLSISLLLVLAWGVGIIMLLYVPIRRYVLEKDISSRKLYVTPSKIVYKVSRPSFIPFWGTATIEKYVPLPMVIDIIIEQGCLQSVYGIHTFRVESTAHGKAAPVDELQVQGVSNPGLLRKVIITEASRIMQGVGRGQRRAALTTEGEVVGRGGSLTDGSTIMKSPMKTLKMTGSPRYSPRHPSSEPRGTATGELLLHKLEEVNKSVKKLEFLVEKSRASPGSS